MFKVWQLHSLSSLRGLSSSEGVQDPSAIKGGSTTEESGSAVTASKWVTTTPVDAQHSQPLPAKEQLSQTLDNQLFRDEV